MKTRFRPILAVAFVAAAAAFAAPSACAAALDYTAPAVQTGDTDRVIANKVAVAQTRGDKFANITTATTTVVKSGEGVFGRLIINTAGAGSTVTIYDNTAASGTKIGTVTSAAQAAILYGVRFSIGLTVVTASGTPADITVVYR